MWTGGMSFHGGFLGVMAALYWYAGKLGKQYFEVLDFIAPLAPFGLGAGRLGNFIGGELWGRPAFHFPGTHVLWRGWGRRGGGGEGWLHPEMQEQEVVNFHFKWEGEA